MKDPVVYSEFGDNNDEAIARPTPELPPQEQPLRVHPTRKGRKGKTVTVITGFQSRPETLKALLKSLKRQCGAGGSVKDNTLEIQGDVVERVVALLQDAGYPAKRGGG
ncbi:translation initiation factor [Geitlerinema sp. P-1104]|uniref:translation initiation factor n=1 Tax=Geitlerinema sp. P-1104 TaxID=2546230 RepID=UPI00147715EB|nr:translation initiation factor [Geitlerinema sp. P-1104]NMG57520.1 translation initiation factor [Geitlerinema sp. P-1104]